jgi:predicted small metal-binding protein
MAYTLACRDAGLDCNYVAKGKTKDELMKNVAEHGKKVHGYTDKQLKDPKMMKKMNELVKEG